jgi:helix-turn-helix protein
MNSNHPVQPSAALKRLSYTRVEAAELLGVTPITVDRLAKRGLLRPSRATRRPLYPEVELVRFLTETSARTGDRK